MTEPFLYGGRLRWLATAPRPSEDALWLAAAVPAVPADTPVLDAGCGNGLVGLALAQRCPGLVLQGLELNPDRVQEATQHAAWAGVHAAFQYADILSWQPPQRYAVIVSNPPFHAVQRGHHSPNPNKALAHGLPALAPWLAALQRMLTEDGTIYLILHAQLLPDLLTFTQPHGGALLTRPLASHNTRPPKRLLACWQPSASAAFQHQSLPVVPAYHTPLREAVLHEGASLAAYGYGW